MSNRKPGKRPPKGGQKGPRSALSANLRRVAGVLAPDMLASALGVTEDTLDSLIYGRDVNLEDQYSSHITHRLIRAGLPSTWLSVPNARILPDQVDKLRRLAAGSENKAPIRRANFGKLVKAFEDRIGVLADALEMTAESVLRVANGQLDFDDQRFNHINPRLMQADLKDGWLDEDDAKLDEAMVENIVKLATDMFELERSEYETYNASQAPSQSQDALTPEAEGKGEQTSTPAATQESEREKPSTAKTTDTKEDDMPETQSTPKPAPGPTKQAKRPALPRGALSAGRNLKGAPPPASRAPKASQSSQASQSSPPTLPKQEKQPTSLGSFAELKSKASGKGTKAAPAERDAEMEEIRTKALEQLFEGVDRRGVKAAVWREVDVSQTTWGNIRRKTTPFSTELARKVEKAMELPDGWLDNPSYPPATIAAWVHDLSVPLPQKKKPEIKIKANTAAPQLPAPSNEPPKPPQKAEPEEQIASADAEATPPPPQAASQAAVSTEAPREVASSNREPKKSDLSGFEWSPANKPQPRQEPGPITHALLQVINSSATEGTFTEADALKLLNMMMQHRS